MRWWSVNVLQIQLPIWILENYIYIQTFKCLMFRYNIFLIELTTKPSLNMNCYTLFYGTFSLKYKERWNRKQFVQPHRLELVLPCIIKIIIVLCGQIYTYFQKPGEIIRDLPASDPFLNFLMYLNLFLASLVAFSYHERHHLKKKNLRTREVLATGHSPLLAVCQRDCRASERGTPQSLPCTVGSHEAL